MENFSGKTQLGNWGKLYFENSATSRVFTGNQYVKTLGLAKTGKALGIVGAGVGIGVGIYKVANHQESLGKFGADGIATGIGFTGVGTIPSILYFGIDAYYTGGIGQYSKDLNNIWYQEYKDPNSYHPGPNFSF